MGVPIHSDKKTHKLSKQAQEWVLANAARLTQSDMARELGVAQSSISEFLSSRGVLVAEVQAEREKTAVRHWLDDKDAVVNVHARLAEALLYNLAYKTPEGAVDYTRMQASGNDLPLVREARAELREIADLRAWIVKQSNIRVSDLTDEQVLSLLQLADGTEAGSAEAGADPGADA